MFFNSLKAMRNEYFGVFESQWRKYQRLKSQVKKQPNFIRFRQIFIENPKMQFQFVSAHMFNLLHIFIENFVFVVLKANIKFHFATKPCDSKRL
jgi:hypothetical protein